MILDVLTVTLNTETMEFETLINRLTPDNNDVVAGATANAEDTATHCLRLIEDSIDVVNDQKVFA